MSSTGPIILVCGFGRCGSSMVMQMLAAGGMPVSGNWPIYEGDQHLDYSPASWAKLSGYACKALDPHLDTPPFGLDYRAIFLSRDEDQQAASAAKFLNAVHRRSIVDATQQLALANNFRADKAAAFSALAALGAPIMDLRFEAILNNPRLTAMKLEGFVGRVLHRGKMVAAVRDRAPNCLPYLLEMQLLAELGKR